MLRDSDVGLQVHRRDHTIRRSSFDSVPQLVAAIEAFLKYYNQNPRVVVWKASAKSIVTRIAKYKETLVTLH